MPTSADTRQHRQVRVLIVCSHRLESEGLRLCLGQDEEIVVVGAADDAAEVLDQARCRDADIVVVGWGWNERESLPLLRRLGAEPRTVPALVIASDVRLSHVQRVIEAGARAILPADVDPDELIHAVRTAARSDELVLHRTLVPGFLSHVTRGRSSIERDVPFDSLTPREQDVARLVARGLMDRDIGQGLFISVRTVQTHLSHIYAKLGVHGAHPLSCAAVHSGADQPRRPAPTRAYARPDPRTVRLSRAPKGESTNGPRRRAGSSVSGVEWVLRPDGAARPQARGAEVVDVTDLDVLAIRFPDPHRRPDPRSSLDLYLEPDAALGAPADAVDLIIGEVKEGKARLNDALGRKETIAFALRRVGCCPEEELQGHARAIARGGRHAMIMGGGAECDARLVVFAGTGQVGTAGVTTVSLEHCIEHLRKRLHASGGLLLGAQFKDQTVGLLGLLEKVEQSQHRSRTGLAP